MEERSLADGNALAESHRSGSAHPLLPLVVSMTAFALLALCLAPGEAFAKSKSGHRYLWHGPSHKGATNTPYYPHGPHGSVRARSSKAPTATAADSSTSITPDSAAGTVAIAAGSADGTAAEMVHDLAAVLDDKSLNIKAASLGSNQTLAEIGASSNIDLAVLPSDALASSGAKDAGAAAKKMATVARLYNAEIHVLAGPAVTDIRQLDGKTIAIGDGQTYAGETARLLFARLKIKPKFIDLAGDAALDGLKSGAVDALLCIDGKPAPELVNLAAPGGTHFVSIPYAPALQDIYYPASLSPADYPSLIAAGTRVDTIAVGTLLVAADVAKGSARYGRIARFSDQFFQKFEGLLQPGHHPKWLEVNLAAATPGWRRFQPAQDWLDKSRAAAAATALGTNSTVAR